MLDQLIKNATIIDGTGSEPFTGSVRIKDEKIIYVGKDVLPLESEKIIDAGNRVLSPGFIDSHGHSDISILAAPEATGKISQGITSEISGNCGLSVFPITSKNREHLQELYAHYNIKIDWSTFAEYAKLVAKIRPAINIASLCGHNTLRAAVAGYENKDLDRCEIRRMEELLLKSVDDGAAGASTGLLYVPGKFANFAELKEFGKVVAKTGKIWTSHLRSEGHKLIESINEFIHIAKQTSCKRIHISHLKTAGKSNWNKLDDAFLRISLANKSGLHVTADRYPYTESMTQLSAYMPEPYSDMDDVELKKHLSESANFAKFKTILKNTFSIEDWKNKRLVFSDSQLIPCELFGKNFIEISEKTGKKPEEIIAEILRDDSPGTKGASRGMSEENLIRILQQPYVCCCTDESARPEDYSIGRSHPRGFGSFPKFIQLLIPLLPLEEIIRKMTSLPAQIFGIEKRGAIREGNFADLVLIDIDKLLSSESANFANPHKKTEGIEKVWVNGKLTYSKGKIQPDRCGKVLA